MDQQNTAHTHNKISFSHKNAMLSFLVKWMELEGLIVEISQT